MNFSSKENISFQQISQVIYRKKIESNFVDISPIIESYCIKEPSLLMNLVDVNLFPNYTISLESPVNKCSASIEEILNFTSIVLYVEIPYHIKFLLDLINTSVKVVHNNSTQKDDDVNN